MNKKFFKTEKFKHGTMATVFTAVFIVLVIVLNVITSALADRFPSMNIDLTSQGLNSLSDKALDVAKNAEYKTTIYLLGTEANYKDDMIYANYNLRYSQVANLAEKMQAAGIKVDAFDALKLAEEAGSAKAVNIVLMGHLSRYFDFTMEEWMEAIEKSVPAKFLELNKKAFAMGREA